MLRPKERKIVFKIYVFLFFVKKKSNISLHEVKQNYFHMHGVKNIRMDFKLVCMCDFK